MLSIQQAHLFETEEEKELAHAARRGGRSSGRSRRSWGFGTAVGAAAGGILLSRNRRVRGLVRKGWRSGAMKRVRKGVLGGLRKARGTKISLGARRGINTARKYVRGKAASAYNSRIGVAARGAYGRVRAKVGGGYTSLKSKVSNAVSGAKRGFTGARKRAAIRGRRMVGKGAPRRRYGSNRRGSGGPRRR